MKILFISLVISFSASMIATSALANNDAEKFKPIITEDPDQTIHNQNPVNSVNEPYNLPVNIPNTSDKKIISAPNDNQNTSN